METFSFFTPSSANTAASSTGAQQHRTDDGDGGSTRRADASARTPNALTSSSAAPAHELLEGPPSPTPLPSTSSTKIAPISIAAPVTAASSAAASRGDSSGSRQGDVGSSRSSQGTGSAQADEFQVPSGSGRGSSSGSGSSNGVSNRASGAGVAKSGGSKPQRQGRWQYQQGGELGGFTQVDWMQQAKVVEKNTARLRAGTQGAVPLSEVRRHRTVDDAWTVIRGKVYDITPYMRYHPGGTDQLMKGAGRDSTALFNKYHPWVNVDFLLDKCFIGMCLPDK